MTTLEQSAFLAAIVAEPDEDSHRLVYADWLSENGDEARSEFIRHQIRIAQIERSLPANPDDMTEDDVIRHDIRECCVEVCHSLLASHGKAWAHWLCPNDKGDKGRQCHRCHRMVEDEYEHHSGEDHDGTWYCSLCHLCGGSGDLFHGAKVTFSRGFAHRVTVPKLEDVVRQSEAVCPACRGDGNLTRFRGPGATNPYRDRCDDCDDGRITSYLPTPRLRAICASTTVREVVPGDRVPYRDVSITDENRRTFEWLRHDLDYGGRSRLPPPIFSAVLAMSEQAGGEGSDFAEFYSPESALTALGRAVRQFGEVTQR